MPLKPWLLSVTAIATLGVATAHAAPEYLPHTVAPNAKPLPFSDAVRVGDTLYVAGHLGLDPRTGQARPIRPWKQSSSWTRCRPH